MVRCFIIDFKSLWVAMNSFQKDFPSKSVKSFGQKWHFWFFCCVPSSFTLTRNIHTHSDTTAVISRVYPSKWHQDYDNTPRNCWIITNSFWFKRLATCLTYREEKGIYVFVLHWDFVIFWLHFSGYVATYPEKCSLPLRNCIIYKKDTIRHINSFEDGVKYDKDLKS